MRDSRGFSRRDLLKAGVIVAAGGPLLEIGKSALAAQPGAATFADPWRGLTVGVASYSLREIPLDEAIKIIQRVDLKYVSIKDAHLPMKSTNSGAQGRRQEVYGRGDHAAQLRQCGHEER